MKTKEGTEFSVFRFQFSENKFAKGITTMKDEKKVKLTEEKAKKEVQTEEKGVKLTDE